ncbi:MAG TPA: hypothetical protein VKA15_02430, partial [Isosphaeraceae bacterium]|nr:hypothetical protein [Isosphaeraceae bacterium]
QPGELRLALSRLEHEPDGWKRCTLAFLEAQCWRDSFRAVEASALSGPGCVPVSLRLAEPKFDRRRIRWWRGAAAAGIITASFALGWLSHVARPLQLAGAVPGDSSSPIAAQKQHDSASEPVVSTSDDPSQQAAFDPRFVADRSAAGSGEVIQTVAQLRIGPEGAGATVPILAGPGIDGDWLKFQPPPLSEREQVILQRHGYQVDQKRRILVGTLADGRRVSVPIDQVQIRYTGTNPL